MAAKMNKLNNLLADLAVENIKLHNLHWNVVGPQFVIIHKMTEKLYMMFQEQFDEVAEVMKMQGEMPLGSLQEYLDNTSVEEIESRDYADIEVLELLDNDCNIIMDLAAEIREEADKNDNFIVANLMEDYLALYAKSSWMIRASLEGEPMEDDMEMEEENPEEGDKEKGKEKGKGKK